MITRLIPLVTNIHNSKEQANECWQATELIMSALTEDGEVSGNLKDGIIQARYLVQNSAGDNIGTIGEIEGELYYFHPSEVTDDLDWTGSAHDANY